MRAWGLRGIVLVLATGTALGQAPADSGRRVTDRLRTLQQEADALLAEEKTLLVELRRLELARAIKTEERRQLDADLATVTRELDEVSAHLAALETSRASQGPALAERLAEVYKLGRGGYVRLLFSVERARDAGRALRTVTALAQLDRERVRAHERTLASLRAARDDLEARRVRAATLREAARQAEAAVERAARDRADLVARIDERRDLNAQLAGELQAAQERLQQAVGALDAGGAVVLPLRPFRGTLEWPVAGPVVTRFGRSRTARFGATVPRQGIEVAAATGNAAAAIHEGTVAFAGPFTGYGLLLILDHGGRSYSLYGHLSSLAVEKGAHVARGQTVGRTGTSPDGRAALYFELRIDGQAVDPLQWLKPRP